MFCKRRYLPSKHPSFVSPEANASSVTTGSSDSVPTSDQVPHEIKTVPFSCSYGIASTAAAVSCPAPAITSNESTFNC